MAEFSRVSPTGWNQGDDTSDISRVAPTGWQQVIPAAPAPLAGVVPFNPPMRGNFERGMSGGMQG